MPISAEVIVIVGIAAHPGLQISIHLFQSVYVNILPLIQLQPLPKCVYLHAKNQNTHHIISIVL